MHDCLKHLYGLGGTVLKWLKSYLSDRVHVVKVRDSLSDQVTDNCGVPQGSVIGPCTVLLFPELLKHMKIPQCCMQMIRKSIWHFVLRTRKKLL